MEKENPANTEEQELTPHKPPPTTTDEQALTPVSTLPPNTTHDQALMTTHTSSLNTTDEQLLLTPDTPPLNTTVEQTLTPVTLQPNTTDEQAVMAHASSSNTTGEQALTINTLSTTISNAFTQAISRILTGRVIVEVCTLEQAKTAASAGACCVCVTPPPSTTISYMPDPSLVREIKRQLSILVMAKVRAGHSVEAQILDTLGIDFIDESETLGITDESHFISKQDFKTPFVSSCCDLGQALNRIREGAVLLRCQGSRPRNSLAETVKSVRKVTGEFARLINTDEDELFGLAERIEAPYEVVARAKQMGRLPLLLASGGIQTPADAALMMKLGCHGVFIGVEVFKYGGATYEKLRSIVRAAREHYDIRVVAEASHGFGDGGGLQEDLAGGCVIS